MAEAGGKMKEEAPGLSWGVGGCLVACMKKLLAWFVLGGATLLHAEGAGAGAATGNGPAAATVWTLTDTGLVGGLMPEIGGEPRALAPLGGGRVSLGTRQDRMSWIRGAIREARLSAEALPAERLQRVPAGAAQ